MAFEFQDLNLLRSVEELQAYRTEVRGRIGELNVEFAGLPFPDNVRGEYADLSDADEEVGRRVSELEARAAHLRSISENDRTQVEPVIGEHDRSRRASSRTASREEDIYDLSTIRSSYSDPEEASRELRDRAMRAVEVAQFAHESASREDCQTHIARMLDTIDYGDSGSGKVAGELARRILVTGSPAYRRAFGKTLANKGLTSEEQRALSLGTGSAGGFAVVFTLDPTIVPTSNFSVNPFRAIARVEQVSGTNEWKAVTSGAITAAYGAEATEAGDNAPTLAQPDIIVEKAQAFVPFSIELGQDFPALASEMASLLQDAKDDLEATKFAVGAGHGSTEPKGLITGATATTTAGGTAAFAIADLYKLFEALPARFRPRAQWVGNLFTYDKIRQFDTAGGSGVWVDAQDGTRGLGPAVGAQDAGAVNGNVGPKLLGKPAWESTAMGSVLTTGTKILAVGDFRYFVIVDRVGMDIEILPHLLGATRRPTGQRGLYAYWRNSSDVLSASAFQVLVTG